MPGKSKKGGGLMVKKSYKKSPKMKKRKSNYAK
jgi:hypothetical protein